MDGMTAVNLRTALNWARLGFRVLPCNRNKRPIVTWKTSATTDSGVIENWWKQYPYAIPGLVTENLLVIDADRKGGIDGVKAFRDFCAAEEIDISGALNVETPSGGEHFIFRTHGPTGIGNHTGRLPAGIDVRSDGKGYIIAPGTRLDDGRQYILKNGPPTDTMTSAEDINLVPDCLVRKLYWPRIEKLDGTPPEDGFLSESICSNGQEMLEELTMSTIESINSSTNTFGNNEQGKQLLRRLADTVSKSIAGSRNDTLNKAAFKAGGYIASGYLSEADAVECLLKAAGECGLIESDGELGARNTIASGISAGRQRPITLGGSTQSGASNAQATQKANQNDYWMICGRKPAQPPKWLVRDCLPQTGIATISAQSGLGKSALALRMAAHIVKGELLFGCEVQRPGGVLVLAAEGSEEIDPRYEALRVRGLVGADAPIAYASSIPRMLDVSQQPVIESRIVEGIQKIRSAFNKEVVLLIVDTVAAAASFKNENDNAEAQSLMNFIRELAQKFGFLVLLIDHVSKNGEDRGSRGASSKDAAADARIMLKKEGELVVISLEKLRSGSKRDLGHFKIVPVEYMKDGKGLPVTAAFAEFVIPSTKVSRAGFDEATEIISRLGKVVPSSNGNLAVPFLILVNEMHTLQIPPIKKESVVKQVNRLIEAGLLVQVNDDEKYVYIS